MLGASVNTTIYFIIYTFIYTHSYTHTHTHTYTRSYIHNILDDENFWVFSNYLKILLNDLNTNSFTETKLKDDILYLDIFSFHL